MTILKHSFLTTVLCTIMSAIAYPQIYVGVSGTAVLPQQKGLSLLEEPGAGFRLNAGYSFGGRLDVGADIEHSWLHTLLPGHTISKVTASSRYHILDQDIRPYLGFEIGYLRSSITPPFGSQVNSYGMSAGPLAGCLVRLNFLDGLHLSTEASYNQVFTDTRFRLVGFRLGLLYYM